MRWLLITISLTALFIILIAGTGEASSLTNDTAVRPSPEACGESTPGPGYNETSEYMIGDVAVSVILVESNGSHEAQTENWNSTEESNVEREINDALKWWVARANESNISLNFNVDYLKVETGYEPIEHKSLTSKQGEGMWLWIDEVMHNLGMKGTGFAPVEEYDNHLREQKKTDWAYVMFVVDSSNDDDGMFSDDHFAFAYLGGPFLVMTYDNENYGIENMDAVAAHETTHIFYALDEYHGADSPTDHSGYLNIENENHVDGGTSNEECIMRGQVQPYTDGAVCNITRATIGWRDLDGDGIPDILDTTPSAELNLKTEYDVSDPVITGTAHVNPYPNHNPYGSGRNVTLNTILYVDYRIDGGTWYRATPEDGSFDDGTEGFSIPLPPLINGNHTLDVRTVNSVHNINTTSFNITINVVNPPIVRVSMPTSGTYSGNITINWSAVDPDGNVTAVLLQYLRGNETANITSWIPNNPPFIWNTSAVEDGIYQIRVLAMDDSDTIGANVSEQFTIDNPDPPEVSIISPSDVTYSESVEVLFNALDPDGDEMNFTIYLSLNGNDVFRTLTTNLTMENSHVSGTTYRFLWDTLHSPPDNSRVPDGSYYLVVKAVDDSPEHLTGKGVSPHFVLNNNDPPAAVFNMSSSVVDEGQTITFTSLSTDPDLDPLTLTWDFGDGVTLTTISPSVNHKFSKNGTMTVTLTVSDGKLKDSVNHTIIVRNLPPVANAGQDITVNEDESFTLSGALSTDTPSDIGTLNYSWVVDNKTYPGRDITLSLPSSGEYTAVLTVTDNDGASDTDSVKITVVNVPPVADAGDFQIANRNETIIFNASGSRDTPSDIGSLTYFWDFGDGSTGSGKVVEHTYSAAGNYTVTLTVTDDDGASDIDVVNVTINSVDVVAKIDTMPDTFGLNSQVHFSAFNTTHPQGMELLYIWDFGDGSKGFGIEITHTYTKGGVYIVRLNVQDNDSHVESGYPYTASLSIHINLRPVAVLAGDTSPHAGESAVYYASESRDPDGLIVKYVFDFGDGTRAVYVSDSSDPDYSQRAGGLNEGKSVRHTFSRTGSYTVNLTVYDNLGACNSAVLKVNVKEKPVTPEDVLNSIYEDPSFDNIYSVYLYIGLSAVAILLVRHRVKKRKKGRKRTPVFRKVEDF